MLEDTPAPCAQPGPRSARTHGPCSLSASPCLRGLEAWHKRAAGPAGTRGWGQEGSPAWCLSLLPAVSRFVKYTGYGNAAGLLAARGLMAGGREEGEYSEDEDTDTEEYKEAKPK